MKRRAKSPLPDWMPYLFAQVIAMIVRRWLD